MAAKEHFYCVGRVRGNCGHKHKSASGAIRCLLQDRGWCKRRGGYSDRRIEKDGIEYNLLEDVGGRLHLAFPEY